ncbi:unnamed protein product [Peniophora sp. CBMAI 1063]|nr:unnamed protein product [Peniophora sp. CBMAI 1063]
MEHNTTLLDTWRNHILGPRLQEVYSGKSAEERKGVYASRIRSILERLLGVASLEMAKKGYELLIQEANFPLKSPHPTVAAMMTLIVSKAGDPALLTSRRRFTRAVDAALDCEGAKDIRMWYGDARWWDYIDQEPESEPEVLAPANPPGTMFSRPSQLASGVKIESPALESLPPPDGRHSSAHFRQWQADRTRGKDTSLHNSRASPGVARLMTSAVNHDLPDGNAFFVGLKCEKDNSKVRAIDVSDDEELQHRPELVPKQQPFKEKPKMKPKSATTFHERSRNPATWYVRGVRYTPDRPAEQVFDHLEPGQHLDLFSLFQLPEMHGMRQADLSVYVIPSAGQKIKIGDNVRFLHPNGFRGTKPQLRTPELHVRVNFLQKLLDRGILKEWPDFIDEDGQINHKDFAKDPAFDVSEATSLFTKVPPYYASEDEYLAVYPRCHEVQVPAFVKQENNEPVMGHDVEQPDLNQDAPLALYDPHSAVYKPYGESFRLQGDADSMQGETSRMDVGFQSQDAGGLQSFEDFLNTSPWEIDDMPARVLASLSQAAEAHAQTIGMPSQALETASQAPEQPSQVPEQPWQAPEQPWQAPGQPWQAPEQPWQTVETSLQAVGMSSPSVERATQAVEPPPQTVERASQTVEVPLQTVERALQTVETPSFTVNKSSQTAETRSRAIEKASQTLEMRSFTVDKSLQTRETPSLADKIQAQAIGAPAQTNAKHGIACETDTSWKAGPLSTPTSPEPCARSPVQSRSMSADVTHIRAQVDSFLSIVTEMHERVRVIQTALGVPDSHHGASSYPSGILRMMPGPALELTNIPQIVANGEDIQTAEAARPVAESGTSESVSTFPSDEETRPWNASAGDWHAIPDDTLASSSIGCSSTATVPFVNASPAPFILPENNHEPQLEGVSVIEGPAGSPASQPVMQADVVDKETECDVDTTAYEVDLPTPSYHLMRADYHGYRADLPTAVNCAPHINTGMVENKGHQIQFRTSDELESASHLLTLAASNDAATPRAALLPPNSLLASDASARSGRTTGFLTLQEEIARASTSSETTRRASRVTPTTPYMPRIVEARAEKSSPAAADEVEDEALSDWTAGRRADEQLAGDMDDDLHGDQYRSQHGRKKGLVNAEDGRVGGDGTVENHGTKRKARHKARTKVKATAAATAKKNGGIGSLDETVKGSGDHRQEDIAPQVEQASKRESAPSTIGPTLRLTRSRASSIDSAGHREDQFVAAPSRHTRSRASSVETAQVIEGQAVIPRSRMSSVAEAVPVPVTNGQQVQAAERKRKRANAAIDAMPSMDHPVGRPASVKRQRVVTRHE